jgi:RNA polymerase sigma factor (sigma-70 family)
MSQAGGASISTEHKEFLSFIQPYDRMIRHTIRQVCGDTYAVLQADVEQEVYLAIWTSWRGSEGIEHPVSYLYKVALRTALAVRRNYAKMVLVDDIELSALIRQELSEDKTLTTERTLMLTAYLEQLSVEQAQAVRAYLAGFTQREIASLYGWSPAVVRHRIYRGLEALKSYALQQEVGS